MSTASEPQSVRNALATKQGGWRWIALAVTAVVAAGAAGWHFHERWANVEAGTVVAGSPAVRVKDVAELVCFKGFYERPYSWRSKQASDKTPAR